MLYFAPIMRTSTVVSSFVALATLTACASDTPVGPTPGSPTFDGEQAMELVRTQVGFGPRVPGREGHATQLAWMVAHLDSTGVEVQTDTFTHVTATGDTLHLTNVLARAKPEATRRILLLTHWDTRPVSDNATDPALRSTPIPGANDGASGTAILLELAGLLEGTAPPMGVDLLFVDGEDYGDYGAGDMLLGAKRYAETLPPPGQGRPIYGVLLDMVGDVDPRFPVESTSVQYAQPVVRKVWGAARRLGFASFFPDAVGQDIGDDHIPLLSAGLPTVDVIDFSYGPGNSWWHTPEDTPDHVSASTLGMVGQVVTELIYSGG
jgi:glutaminyl-peptide cyclotransferase